MKTKEFIERYGIEAHEKQLARGRAWISSHLEQSKARSRAWRAANPEQVKASNNAWRAAHLEEKKVSNMMWRAANPEQVKAGGKAWRAAHPEHVKRHNAENNCKCGKFYEKKLEYSRTGLPHEKNLVRGLHNRRYTPYK